MNYYFGMLHNVNKYKYIIYIKLPGGASALKDEIWHTWTVTLGWPV